MANPTAARWFGGNDGFVNNRADYAFPGRNAAEIKQQLRSWDFRLYGDLPWTYYGYAPTSDSLPCYGCATRGALVFADVIGTAEHKELLKNLRANNELSKDEIELVKESEHDIREKLAAIYKSNPLRDPDTPVANEGNTLSLKDHTRLQQRIRMDGAYLRPELVSFVLSRGTAKQKAAVLNLYSGEGHSRHPRPTLMIIDMFDEAKATCCGESSGYVIAYDFLSSQIIIKHWSSSLDHHPLEDPWFAQTQDEGVLYVGRPRDLLHQILTREGLAKDSPTYGFALLTRFLAGRWMSSYFDQLDLGSTAAPDQSLEGRAGSACHDEHAQLKAVLASYALELDTLEVPGVETDSNGRKKNTYYRKPHSVTQELYVEVLDFLESREMELAEIAVGERDAGKVKAAENLAKFYDETSQAARVLLDNPDANFTFDYTNW